MKILLLSDMHFGISQRTHGIWERYWDLHLASEDWDAVILAGDIGTSRLDHWETAIRFVSSRAKGKPVYHVRGNHDLWDKGTRNLHHLFKQQQDVAKDTGVHLLQDDGPAVQDGVLLCGWDGWYANPPQRHTNDFMWISSNMVDGWGTDAWLNRRAADGVDACIDQVFLHKGPKIVVTHMPCLPGFGDPKFNASPHYGEALLGIADFLVWGHSHRQTDIVIQGTRILNCGSDYDNPAHLFFLV